MKSFKILFFISFLFALTSSAYAVPVDKDYSESHSLYDHHDMELCESYPNITKSDYSDIRESAAVITFNELVNVGLIHGVATPNTITSILNWKTVVPSNREYRSSKHSEHYYPANKLYTSGLVVNEKHSNLNFINLKLK